MTSKKNPFVIEEALKIRGPSPWGRLREDVGGRLWTLDEVASAASVSHGDVLKDVEDGIAPHVLIGNVFFFPEDEIEEYIQERLESQKTAMRRNPDGNGDGWGAVPGMWGVKQRLVGLEWGDITRIASEEPAGTVLPVIARGSESGKDILVLAVVLGDKSFKWAKKAVTVSGGLSINLYIDDLVHPDLECVIPIILVEIKGIAGTARGIIDVADIAANGKLLGLEEAAKRGTVDFLLVDARGRSLHITGISSPVAPAVARVTDGIMGAVDAYRDQPWSIDTFEQAFIDLDHMLDSYDVRSIDDHKEVRRMAEEDMKEEDIEFEA